MANKTKREDRQDSVQDQVRRDWLRKYFGDMVWDTERFKSEVIPTSSYMLNYILGIGGIPTGRVIQLAGAESSGKTTLCMDIMKNTEDMGYSFLFFDAEQTFNVDLAKQMGIKTPPEEYLVRESRMHQIMAKLIGPLKDLKKQEGILLPDSEVGDYFLNEKKLKVIVIDSLNSLITPRSESSDLEKGQVGHLSSYLSYCLPLLVPKLSFAGVSLIGVQQLRENIGTYGKDPTTTTGGRAWKHNVSVAINLTPRTAKEEQILDASGAKMGTTVKAYISKSKVARAYLSGDYKVVFGRGITEPEGEVFAVAVRTGVLERPNNITYKFGELTWRGEAAVKKAIAEDVNLSNKLKEAIQANKDAGICAAVEDELPEGYLDDDQEIA